MKRVLSIVVAAVALCAAFAGVTLAQQQRPQASVAAVGQLEPQSGKTVWFSVWVARRDDDGGSPIMLTDGDFSFDGTVEQASVSGGQATLRGEGVLSDGGSAQGQGPTTREVTFEATVERGNPHAVSARLLGGSRAVKTIEGKVATGELELR